MQDTTTPESDQETRFLADWLLPLREKKKAVSMHQPFIPVLGNNYAVGGMYGGLTVCVLDTALSSWARHFTLIVPLFNQVYKWVPAGR